MFYRTLFPLGLLSYTQGKVIMMITCLWAIVGLFQGTKDRKILTKINCPSGFFSAEIHKSDFNILKLFYVVLEAFGVFPWDPIPKIQKRVESTAKYLLNKTNLSSVAQSVQKL